MFIRTEDLNLPNAAALEWLFARAAGHDLGGYLRFESRCPHLTKCGGCDLHDTPLKPRVCIEYEPGGSDCLDTVRRRRTPEQYQLIRDEGDPARIHE